MLLGGAEKMSPACSVMVAIVVGGVVKWLGCRDYGGALSM